MEENKASLKKIAIIAALTYSALKEQRIKKPYPKIRYKLAGYENSGSTSYWNIVRKVLMLG